MVLLLEWEVYDCVVWGQGGLVVGRHSTQDLNIFIATYLHVYDK